MSGGPTGPVEDAERGPSAATGAGVFFVDGEVGRDLAVVDWAATPLGPPEQWPQSLQTAVSILLSSRFSMWMAWGPELTFFCNAAYRRDPSVVRTEQEMLAFAGRQLGGNLRDLPFTQVCLFDDDRQARLAATTGIEAGHPAAPVTIPVGAPGHGARARTTHAISGPGCGP